MKRPLLPAVLISICIILLAQAGAPLWTGFAAAAFLCVVLLLNSRCPPVGVFVLLLPVLLILFRAQALFAPSAVAYGGEPTVYSGTVTDTDVKRTKLTVRLSDYPDENVLLSLQESCELNPGDTVSFSTVLRRPDSARNPGGFDYRLYLLGKNSKSTGRVLAGDITKTGSKHTIFLGLRAFRMRLVDCIFNSFSEADAELISAIVLGCSVSDETRASYAGAGAAHILAVSGLHIGFVCAFVSGLLRLTGWSRKARLAVEIPALVLYLMMTGLGASAVRAVLMALILLFAGACSRTYDTVSALCFSALIILCFSPGQLFQAGFMLSFLAVLAIALFYSPVLARFIQADTRPDSLTATVLMSICATVGTVPASLYYFHTVSLTGLFSNILFIPAAALLTALALPTVLLLAVWPSVGALFVLPVSFVAGLFSRAAALFSAVPFLTLSQSALGAAGVLVMVFIALVCTGYLRLTRLSGLMVGAVLCLFIVGTGFYGRKTMTVTFLDVGQGDAALIEMPNGTVCMVDGGGYEEGSYAQGSICEEVLLPALMSKGIDKIDCLFITHSHDDHQQGAVQLLAEIPVKQVFVNPGCCNTALISQTAVPVTKLSAGMTVQAGPAVFETAGPAAGEMLAEDAQNNNSLVLRLTYGSTAFLFTGDAEAEEEGILDAAYLDSDVLKVGHHGSKTSTGAAFLNAVSPSLAVISVGRYNTYGHPHAETLMALAEAEVPVVRTDRGGAITCLSDGTAVRFNSAITDV